MIRIISVVMNGLVDSEKGVSIFSPHYNTKNIPIVERFQKKFNKKVYVENDVRVMALVEKTFGECKKIITLLFSMQKREWEEAYI